VAVTDHGILSILSIEKYVTNNTVELFDKYCLLIIVHLSPSQQILNNINSEMIDTFETK